MNEQKCVEMGVGGGAILKGVISPDGKKISIYIVFSREPPLFSGEFDLSNENVMYNTSSEKIELSADEDIITHKLLPIYTAEANYHTTKEFWFDFLDEIIPFLVEPYRGRLKRIQAAILAILLTKKTKP